MIETVEGIVVSEQKYKDTSKIINLYTPKYGIIGIIAKGCLNIKSKLRSMTDIMTYGEYTIYYKENKLSILKEANSLNSFKNIRSNFDLINYSTYLIDLSTQVYKQNNDSEIYNILISSLKKINDLFDPIIIVNIVELKYLNYLGVMPSLTGCCVCGSTNIVTLSGLSGGYLCSKCLRNEPIISDKTMKLIRMYYYVDINKIEKLNISNSIKYQIDNFLTNYYERYTGLYLKKYIKK